MSFDSEHLTKEFLNDLEEYINSLENTRCDIFFSGAWNDLENGSLASLKLLEFLQSLNAAYLQGMYLLLYLKQEMKN